MRLLNVTHAPLRYVIVNYRCVKSVNDIVHLHEAVDGVNLTIIMFHVNGNTRTEYSAINFLNLHICPMCITAVLRAYKSPIRS